MLLPPKPLGGQVTEIFSRLREGFRVGWRRGDLWNVGEPQAMRDMPLVDVEETEFENALAAFKSEVAAPAWAISSGG